MRKIVLALAVASLGLQACDECAKSADVLVEFDGDDAVLAQVSTVELTVVSEGGAQQDTPIVSTGKMKSGSTVLLSATTTPATSTYSIAITALLRDANGRVIARATASALVGAHACNRVHIDVAAPPDMACMPDVFDEDQDGLSDPCDVCAVTADNPDVDSDGDGVPDACDPSSEAVNQVALFEPFNTAPSTWLSGTGQSGPVVADGQLVLDGTSECTYLYSPSSVGPSMVLQTTFTPKSFDPGKTVSVGIFGIDAGTGDTEHGIACFVQTDGTNAFVVIQQGVIFSDSGMPTEATTTSSIVTSTFMVGAPSHLELVADSTTAKCTVSAPDGTQSTPVMVARTATQPDLLPGVSACWADADFASLFAVTAPPP